MKINAIIVDDEDQARLALRRLITEYIEEISLVGECDNGKDALKMIRDIRPDLVFMDVLLENVKGFDIIDQIKDYNFNVIYVSAHAEFGYHTIKANAIDYLLKPVRINDLRQAVNKVKERMLFNLDLESHILVRSTNYDQATNLTIVPDATGFTVIRLCDIIRCEASRNYSVITLVTGKQIAAVRGISDLELSWGNFGFVRVHKSHLINIYAIRKYHRGRSGEVEMMDGIFIPVSRDRKEKLFEKFLR